MPDERREADEEPPQRRRVRLLPLACAALMTAVVVVLGNWIGAVVDRLVFHPSPGAQPPPSQLDLRAEDVYLETDDGVRIHAYWLPARETDRAFLFLHGNAGNASHRLGNAARLSSLGAHVLLVDYRGYGLSQGRPTESGLYADSQAALAHLTGERGIAADRIVVFGRSLGSAVAVELARDRPLAGVILESAFTNIEDVARSAVGWPLSFLARGRFDSQSKIATVTAPLLFFHGDADRIVPYELGRNLFQAAPEPKAFETLRGANHNDTVQVGGEAYFRRIGAFLDHVAQP